MKKKKGIVILICALLAISILVGSYGSYGREQAYRYANNLVELTHRPSFNGQLAISGDVQVEKIVKQTPFELVFLIKWGDNEKAYVTVKNLMVKNHHQVEVQAIDKNKFIMLYQ